nr:hypothetical protein [Tanacetum cinerariifolium]
MSNKNTNLQTQTSNGLHNAIMEAGGKDHPPMLAPVAEGSSKMTTKGYMKSYKNVSRDIRNQLDDESVQIILTEIDNDIYSTVDACLNACEMWKAIERVVNEHDARENVGTQLVKQYGIQCYNCKEYGYVSKEYQKSKWAKDAAYHNEKMLLCKQEEAGIQLSAKQADWRGGIDDEPKDQELEAHYLYMVKIQGVTPDATDNSGPIFDTEPLQKVQNDNDNYNVFANDREHPEQPKFINDTYLEEQGDTNHY